MRDSFFNNYDAFIFDLDGTIYRGNSIIPFADETINYLKQAGKKIIFISNKTTGSINDYFLLLKSFGLNIDKNEIVNATVVIKQYLQNKFAGKNFYAIAEQIFIDEIISSGLNYSEKSDEIDIVIISLDRKLNFEKLEVAAKALENGARFFAANIDDTCPVDGGEIIDAGSTISALEKRTHRKLEDNFGKPSVYMIDEIMKRLNLEFSKCLLIGDRLETDIAMGNTYGIDTALVKTGVKHFNNGNGKIKPTFEFDSVYDLIKKR